MCGGIEADVIVCGGIEADVIVCGGIERGGIECRWHRAAARGTTASMAKPPTFSASRPATRGRHVRKLVVPLVLSAALVAGGTALVTSSTGCGDGDGPRPDGGPGDGGVDTPII